MIGAVVGTVALIVTAVAQVIGIIAAADRNPWAVWSLLAGWGGCGVGVAALWW